MEPVSEECRPVPAGPAQTLGRLRILGLQRNIEQGRTDEAGELVKELTIWSRQAEGTFSPEQDARLKIAYADLAFRKGALPTARAWYRKVADAAEYAGHRAFLDAALGSVKVDRVAKDFSTAMADWTI